MLCLHLIQPNSSLLPLPLQVTSVSRVTPSHGGERVPTTGVPKRIGALIIIFAIENILGHIRVRTPSACVTGECFIALFPSSFLPKVGSDSDWNTKYRTRSYCPNLIHQVLDRWATPVNQLRSQTHRALREYLRDGKTSYSSHFGAMSALVALGPAVLDECLLPQMDQYLTSTKDKVLGSEPFKRSNEATVLDPKSLSC